MPDPFALIFDLDGTLIDSLPEIHSVANKVFAEKGLQPLSLAVVRSAVGNGVDVLVSRLLKSQDHEAFGPQQAELVAKFVKNYEEAFDLTSLYPGVTEALTQFAEAGHPMGICTNKPVGPARAILRHFGLEAHFRVVIGGDSLPTLKPDPASLFAAIHALNSSSALFVGDSEVDAETARAAQVPLALYTQGYRTAPAETLGAKLIFDSFSALPALVAHLSPRLRANRR